MYKLIDRCSNYGSNKRVMIQLDEQTFGTVLDAIGNMSEVTMQAIGLNENQVKLLLSLYKDATNANWYVENLGK